MFFELAFHPINVIKNRLNPSCVSVIGVPYSRLQANNRYPSTLFNAHLVFSDICCTFNFLCLFLALALARQQDECRCIRKDFKLERFIGVAVLATLSDETQVQVTAPQWTTVKDGGGENTRVCHNADLWRSHLGGRPLDNSRVRRAFVQLAVAAFTAFQTSD